MINSLSEGNGTPNIRAGTLIEALRQAADTASRGTSLHFATDPDPCLKSGVWEAALGYGDLDRAARAVAVQLWDHGGKPGDRVLLLYPPGLDFTIGFWGAVYAGMIAVPLPLPRSHKAKTSSARLRSVVRSCGARMALTTLSTAGKLARTLAEAGGFEGLTLLPGDTVDLTAAERWIEPDITPETVAYLQYSSGSTGTPKGAALRHSNVLANSYLIGGATGIQRGWTVCSWLPTFHDMGLMSAAIVSIVYGLQVYQMPPLAFVHRPLDWLRMMSVVRAELGVAPTFAYELCVRRIPPGREQGLDLSNWKVAFCGAEPIRYEALQSFIDRFEDSKFSADAMFPCYGMAESVLMICGGPVGEGMCTTRVDPVALAAGQVVPVADDVPGQKLVASGTQCGGTEVLAVDPETLAPCPETVVGEMVLRGDSVGLGYWGDPVSTANTFNLTVPGRGDGFLRSGDLGFVHEGQAYVTGRRKDLIIIDGANHYPQDLEVAAGSVHPALRAGACAAFQLVDPDRSRLVLVAEVDRSFRFLTEQTMTTSEIVAAIHRAVSADCSLPLDDILLVKQGSLPMTTSGKIQRFAAAEKYRAGGFASYLLDSLHPRSSNDECGVPLREQA